MAEFNMPSLGADMDAGELVEWLVAPGDAVERGQIVAVVETQKGAIDVEIFESGTIVELIVPVGEKVPVGTTLALLRGPGETDEQVREAYAARRERAEPGPPTAATSPAAAPTSERAPDAGPAPAVADRGARRLSPRARKLAAELGVDEATLEELRKTAPGGVVTGEQIEAAAKAKAKPTAATGMREAVGAAMARSKREIPHYYLAHTVDLEPALQWLEARNAERPIDARLLPVTLMIHAIARALGEHPGLSGHWREGFVAGDGVHVGVAVALRGGGLVNPAIRDADRLDLDALNKAILDVGTRARAGGLRASEFDAATITVTNLGERGVDTVFGVIVPPQVAIVGLGTIRRRPWVVDEAVVPRRLVELTLSADHRASDGHTGARFLARVDQLLQSPEAW
jgi:pyruvate dehydrogenase E2 component (dihydrolipoamide acetyltransferase)